MIKAISQRGKGPYEYQRVHDLALDSKGEIIYVLDNSQSKILKLDLKAGTVKYIKTDNRQILDITLFDEKLFAYSIVQQGEISSIEILCLNDELNKYNLFYSIKLKTHDKVLNVGRIYSRNNLLYVINPFDNCIFILNKEKDIEETIRIRNLEENRIVFGLAFLGDYIGVILHQVNTFNFNVIALAKDGNYFTLDNESYSGAPYIYDDLNGTGPINPISSPTESGYLLTKLPVYNFKNIESEREKYPNIIPELFPKSLQELLNKSNVEDNPILHLNRLK